MSCIKVRSISVLHRIHLWAIAEVFVIISQDVQYLKKNLPVGFKKKKELSTIGGEKLQTETVVKYLNYL